MTSSDVLSKYQIWMSTCLSIIVKNTAVIFTTIKHETKLKPVALMYNLVIKQLLLVDTFGTYCPSLSFFSPSEIKQTSHILYLKMYIYFLLSLFTNYIYIFYKHHLLPWTPKFTKYKEELHYLARRKITQFPNIFQLDFDVLRRAW